MEWQVEALNLSSRDTIQAAVQVLNDTTAFGLASVAKLDADLANPNEFYLRVVKNKSNGQVAGVLRAELVNDLAKVLYNHADITAIAQNYFKDVQDQPIWMIEALGVSSSFQKKGLGSLLLSNCINDLSSAAATTSFLIVAWEKPETKYWELTKWALANGFEMVSKKPLFWSVNEAIICPCMENGKKSKVCTCTAQIWLKK